MSAEERPVADAIPARTTGVPEDGARPRARASSDSRPGARRLPLALVGLLGGWVVLSGLLCYLVDVAVPNRPSELASVAAVVTLLGAALALAVTAERRAGERRLASALRTETQTLRSIEAVTDPGLAYLDLDELLGAVLARTQEAVGGDLLCVLLTNEEGTVLRVRASHGETRYAPIGSEIPIGEGLLGTAAQWARPVVVTDVADAGAGTLPESQRDLASLVAAPLVVHGTTLGFVEVGSLKRRTFGPADLRLLQVVADRFAALIERARLDDMARRNRYGAEHANMHLRMLARGGTVLGKALENFEEALDSLADVVVPDFADWFAVYVLEDAGKLRRSATRARPKGLDGHVFKRSGHPHPEGDRLVRVAIAEHRPQVLMSTARLDPAAIGAALHTPADLGECDDVGSMLIIPVQVRGSFMAALSFVTAPDRRAYRPSDLETGAELADRVGVAMERVVAWRANQRASDMALHYAERLRRLVDAALVVNAQFQEAEVLSLLAEHAHKTLDADFVAVSGIPAGDPIAENVWPVDVDLEAPGADHTELAGVVHAATVAVQRAGEIVRRPDEWSGPEPGEGTGLGAAAASARTDASGALPARLARGWVAAPITDVDGEIRHVVVAVGAAGVRFNFEDESVLTLLAQMASIALRNARLYAEVRDNEQRLETVVDSSPLAIAEVHRNGEAQWWNPAAGELFGWKDRSEPRRIPVRPGSELVLAGLFETALAGKPIIGVAMPVRRADEEHVEVSVSASPLGMPGEVNGLLIVAEDVTERQRLLEQFNKAERLNAMTHMAGAVAHDFNNLLTVILGCSDVLLRRVGDDDELAPDVAAIHRAGTRAAALTSQLVRIGGQQHPVQPELVDVDEVIGAMVPMLAGVLGENVHLEIGARAGRAVVIVDRSELERSVLNLAINARDAMPTGGTFSIETALARDASSRGPKVVELSLADTGIGMDELTASHCFEPFYTTKGRAQGTGLGLATVQATVTQAGGAVRIDTAPGRGTRFTLSFPASEGRHDLPVGETGGVLDVVPGGAGGEMLLVVDDEREVLRLEVRELEAAGYQVASASNASEALHLLNTRGGAVDLLVTDVVMPGMNGIELAAAVKWRYPHVGVLFVSGHLEDDHSVRGPVPEHASLLTKPFGPDELSRRVREALNRARATTPARRPKPKRLQGSKR